MSREEKGKKDRNREEEEGEQTLGADVLRTWQTATRHFKGLVSKTCFRLHCGRAGSSEACMHHQHRVLSPREKLAMLETVVEGA